MNQPAENLYASPSTIVNPVPRRSLSRRMLPYLLAAGIILLLLAMLLPVGRARHVAQVHQCRTQLKNIANALFQYHDEFGMFPPAATYDSNGLPLHSWRVLVLPYLDQKALYESIDLSKPWYHPSNRNAFETEFNPYRCPAMSSNTPDGYTNYLAMVGEQQALHPLRPRTKDEFKDNADETLLVIEVTPDKAVHWMSPSDADVDVLLATAAATAKDPIHTIGFNGVLLDGMSRIFWHETKPEALRAFSTIAGNESLSEF